ncbi:MAG: type VI secretion system membrane subunit TssM [Inquilinus sp.]|nr:type VI secretion system membrane subunit TssM [Inquilinus sp.]
MLKKIVAVLTAKWLITLIGAIVLSLLVWFFGPLLAFAEARPLESDLSRFITVMVIIVVWGLANLFAAMREKKSNDQMIDDLVEAPVSPDETASADEVAQLKERSREALALLKKAKLAGGGGRQYLYQLPWYILIGPPGSGKTTALLNSGLRFPLAEQFGKDEIRNVGGTRNCDWFFTDEAVLIDTAGRYTTQDSHQAVDKAAWTGFLELLQKNRPRQPINGALIAISLADMAVLTESERTAHARQIKLRVRELHETLGVRFPIYVLFTKADLMAGFVEFFDDFGREEREQPWGMTFPLDDGKDDKGAVAGFGREFDQLLERLNNRMVERLNQEPDVQRRAMIYGFPAQIASLREPMRDFLTEVFKPSKFEERPLLRGVYFTSGTQEGTPIDRLMGAMAATFGLNRQSLSAFSGSGRSYFLTRPLRSIVFPEASMVSANRRVETLRLWTQRAAYAAAIGVVVAMAGIWINGFFGNRALVQEYEAGMAQYAQQLQAVPVNSVSDANLLMVLPPLETLRNLPGGYGRRDEDVPVSLTFGLYQGDRLGARATATYRRALSALFQPRMLVRLEAQLRANLDSVDYVYEALKVYLIVGGQGPMDADLVRQWMALDWGTALAGEQFDDTRRAMTEHLDVLLETPVRSIDLDGPLIERAQSVLASLSPARRGYELIKTAPQASGLPFWRPVDAGGPQAASVLVRLSGAPLSDGIPGLFTYRGFHEAFLPALSDAKAYIESENWVLGPQAQIMATQDQLDRLESDILALYLDDFGDRWDEMLSDVRMAPPGSDLSAATEMLNILQGPNSPYRLLMQSMAVETKLVRPPAEAGAGEAALGRVGTAAAGRLGTVGRLGTLVVGAGGEAQAAPGQPINDRFKWLHDYVGAGDGTPAPIDQTIQKLSQLYAQMNAARASRDPLKAMSDMVANGVTDPIRTEAAAAPPAVGDVLRDVADKVDGVTNRGTAEQLRAEWRSNVLPVCTRALNSRYPLYRGADDDVNLDDFTRLFSPGGLIDSFFNANLVGLVDTSSRPWRWAGGTQLGISNSDLAQFERARQIRDSLFLGGGGPSANFDITPLRLDPSATQVLMEVDGQPMSYSHGPPTPQPMKWPGDGPSLSRLTFAPQLAGLPSTISVSGPWSFFRLLDQGSIQGSSKTDQFSVTFNVGGRTASFQIRANSVFNPFTLRALGQFRCPSL